MKKFYYIVVIYDDKEVAQVNEDGDLILYEDFSYAADELRQVVEYQKNIWNAEGIIFKWIETVSPLEIKFCYHKDNQHGYVIVFSIKTAIFA